MISILAQTLTASGAPEVDAAVNHVVTYVTAVAAGLAAIATALFLLASALQRAREAATTFKNALVSTVRGVQAGMDKLPPDQAATVENELKKEHDAAGVMPVVEPIVKAMKKEEESKP